MEVKREWFEKDYYSVLGVPNTASEKEVQKAYRDLARELHPDKNPGHPAAEDRFKEVSAAYDVIGDAETRQQYDEAQRMGPASMGGPGGDDFSRGGPGGVTFDVGDLGDLSDLFGGAFGAGGGRFTGGRPSGPRRGRDQEAQLGLGFNEAVGGVTTTLTLSEPDGTSRSLKVRIPAGVDDGQRIRLREKGGPGFNGGPRGDLYVIVRVSDHDLFGRDGANLMLEVPVTFAEAALGADLKVPTFDGDRVTLRLPAGTQSGRTFRVKGRGITTSKGSGDLLVTVEVAVPTKLTDKQHQALEAFAEASTESPRGHLEQT